MMLYGKKYGGADPQLIEGDVFQMIISVPEFDQLGHPPLMNGTQSKDARTSSPSISTESSGKGSGKILELLRSNATISITEIALAIGISERAVEKHIANLRRSNVLRRIGPARGGKWEVLA